MVTKSRKDRSFVQNVDEAGFICVEFVETVGQPICSVHYVAERES
jgi:hypothetical protein